MATPFEDITVVRFEAGQADQGPAHQSLFRFQFLLSREAPELWVRLAGEALGDGHRNSPHLMRPAWAQLGRVVVLCHSDDAQGVKGLLNGRVLPEVNARYRAAVEGATLHPHSQGDQQQAILGDVRRAIRDQA